jgi:hypothetical protein
MSTPQSNQLKVELAKSGRSKCRGCQEKILKDTPRVGIPYPFTTPKGEVITSFRYYHLECTPRFNIAEVLSVLDKFPMEEDTLQKEAIQTLTEIKEGKFSPKQKTVQPYLEYSKSSRGKCRSCEEKIIKDSLRIAEPTLVELDDGRRFASNQYFHPKCYFLKIDDSQSVLKSIIDFSIEKKSIDLEDADTIEKSFTHLIDSDSEVNKIITSISSEPIELSVIYKLSKERGVEKNLLDEAIERNLMEGVLFKPTDDTIQRLE